MSAARGKVILFAGLGLTVIGLAFATSSPAYATEIWLNKEEKKKGKGKVGKTLKDAAKSFSKEVVASARKWAASRGIPTIDVLTTILLESRGNPSAHALSAKEDSRGTMQVNIRAHGDLLKQLGYGADDLYKTDVGIEVGTHLLASKRKTVLALIQKSGRKQEYTSDVLTRLYYAGPKYAQAWILKGTHFKNMETYVDHWKEAKQAVAEAMTEGAYS
jgi:soluble lytic murein transglycosylase-like protein